MLIARLNVIKAENMRIIIEIRKLYVGMDSDVKVESEKMARMPFLDFPQQDAA